MRGTISYGFTLIEILVAISIISTIALFSLVGIDAMSKVSETNARIIQENVEIQLALNQWDIDLSKSVHTNGIEQIFWDGSVFFVTRRSLDLSEGLQIAAWVVRSGEKNKFFSRWISGSIKTYEEWKKYKQQALKWSNNNNEEDKWSSVMIAQDMQVLFWINSGWISITTESLKENESNIGSIFRNVRGVRLIINTQDGHITKDWINLSSN